VAEGSAGWVSYFWRGRQKNDKSPGNQVSGHATAVESVAATTAISGANPTTSEFTTMHNVDFLVGWIVLKPKENIYAFKTNRADCRAVKFDNAGVVSHGRRIGFAAFSILINYYRHQPFLVNGNIFFNSRANFLLLYVGGEAWHLLGRAEG
jgi:hypothetical protein